MRLQNFIKPHVFASLAVVLIAACTSSTPTVMEEPTILAEVSPSASRIEAPSPVIDAAPASRSSYAPIPRQGVITAGDIDDALNLSAFKRYLTKAARMTKLPTARLSRPVLVQLFGANGAPAPGVYVTLRKPGAAEPFYAGYSGVDGHVTVFTDLYEASVRKTVDLRAFDNDQGESITQRITLDGTRKRIGLPFNSTWAPEFLDLAFVVDTTGSMADELDWLTRELKGIVSAAKRSAPGVDIRFGLVVYRDHGDDYVVRNYGFTNKISKMRNWLRQQNAAGGGDYPEAAAMALTAGANLRWRRGKGERLMFHIADAPPHNKDARAYLNAAREAARSNVQIFALGASGVAAESEFLMRQAAVQTNGRYMFLTDDSGIGSGHAEPTISCYRVTKLNDLVRRVLKSELSGIRIEAPARTVIRTVGSYAKGRCQT